MSFIRRLFRKKKDTTPQRKDCDNKESVISFEEFNPSDRLIQIGKPIKESGKPHCYTIKELSKWVQRERQERPDHAPRAPATNDTLSKEELKYITKYANMYHISPHEFIEYLDYFNITMPHEYIEDEDEDEDEYDKGQYNVYFSDDVMIKMINESNKQSRLHQFASSLEEWNDMMIDKFRLRSRNGIIAAFTIMDEINDNLCRIPMEINYTLFDNIINPGHPYTLPYFYFLTDNTTVNVDKKEFGKISTGTIVQHGQQLSLPFNNVFTITIMSLAYRHYGDMMSFMPDVAEEMKKRFRSKESVTLFRIPYVNNKEIKGIREYRSSLEKIGFQYVNGVSDKYNELYLAIDENEQIVDVNTLQRNMEGGQKNKKLKSRKSSSKRRKRSSMRRRLKK